MSNSGNYSNSTASQSPPTSPAWKILKILGSFLYIITGAINLKLLMVRVESGQLTPHMAYINSFMCWSAIIFGPLQIITDVIVPLLGYTWTLKFDYWYTLPNFGWALEWGWQLFDSDSNTQKAQENASEKRRCNTTICQKSNSKSKKTNVLSYNLGARGLIILIISIASIILDCRYLGGHMFPFFGVECASGSRHPGYDVAFFANAIPAVVLAVVCALFFRHWKVYLCFGLFLVGFIGFMGLQDLHHHLSPDITDSHWFESVKEIGIKLCDNTQINFSIWFFVYMFQLKNSGARAASEKNKASTIPIE